MSAQQHIADAGAIAIAGLKARTAQQCRDLLDTDSNNPGQVLRAILEVASLLHEAACVIEVAAVAAPVVELPKPQRSDPQLKRDLAALAARVDRIEAQPAPAGGAVEPAAPGEPVTLPADVAAALYRLTLIGMEVIGADAARCTTESARAAMAAANEPLAQAGLYLQRALGKAAA